MVQHSCTATVLVLLGAFASLLVGVTSGVAPIVATPRRLTGLDEDRAALVAFYDAMDGDNNDYIQGWDTAGTGSPCGWAGITCSGDRVTQISLDNKNLQGAF